MSMSTFLSPKPKNLKQDCFRSPNSPLMGFKEGDSVEVSSKEEGFLGSYYQGKVVAKLPSRNEYVIEYTTLLEEDLSGPLREVVPAEEVRPVPPSAHSAARFFGYGARVDAFDNDGWWVGTVTGMNHKEGRYYVYFEYFGVGIVYDVNRIRIHQDWKEGRWSIVSM